jgi:hypothetical protein
MRSIASREGAQGAIGHDVNYRRLSDPSRGVADETVQIRLVRTRPTPPCIRADDADGAVTSPDGPHDNPETMASGCLGNHVTHARTHASPNPLESIFPKKAAFTHDAATYASRPQRW